MEQTSEYEALKGLQRLGVFKVNSDDLISLLRAKKLLKHISEQSGYSTSSTSSTSSTKISNKLVEEVEVVDQEEPPKSNLLQSKKEIVEGFVGFPSSDPSFDKLESGEKSLKIHSSCHSPTFSTSKV